MIKGSLNLKLIMVLMCLLWGAFAFFYYRSVITRYIRHKQYREYADLVFTTVAEHFSELQKKNEHLVKDLGYQKSDSTPWEREVERFINLTIAPKLSWQTKEGFLRDPRRNMEFSTLAYNFVMDLMCHSKMPAQYNLKELINSIEDNDSLKNLYDGTVHWLPGKQLGTKLAMLFLSVLVLASPEPSMASDGTAFIPMEACNALSDESGFLPTKSGYSELSDGVYTCATLYKDTPGGSMPNNFSMYGKGSPGEVTRVRIMLNVNVKKNAARDTKELGRLCQKMIEGLTGGSPAGFAAKVSKGQPFESEFSGYRTYLTKSIWPTGRGFELNCGISTLTHKE